MKKVLITGASGFVGKAIRKELKQSGFITTLLLHKNIKDIAGERVITGDITEYESFADKAYDIDVIINLVGIIKEKPQKGITFEKLHIKSTENIIRLAKDRGVKRILQISANGAKDTNINRYQQTKYFAERLLQESGVDYTIIRSSSIFGIDDKFINLLIKIIKASPIYPVFGDGCYRLSPISVNDIAKIFVASIDDKRTFNKVFSIEGSKIYQYEDIIQLISQSVKYRNIKVIHLPLLFVRFMIALKIIPITANQLAMLLEGDLADCENINKTLCVKLESFESYIRNVLK